MSAYSTAGLSSRICGLRYVSIFRNITAQCSQYELTPNDPVRRRLTAYEMLSHEPGLYPQPLDKTWTERAQSATRTKLSFVHQNREPILRVLIRGPRPNRLNHVNGQIFRRVNVARNVEVNTHVVLKVTLTEWRLLGRVFHDGHEWDARSAYWFLLRILC